MFLPGILSRAVPVRFAGKLDAQEQAEMSSFDGNYLANNPVAQVEWRQRQIRITRAVLAGASVATLAAQEGVTRERVRQILQMACVHSIKVPKRKVKLPMNNPWSMASLRDHREFWLARLATLERVWKLPRRNEEWKYAF